MSGRATRFLSRRRDELVAQAIREHEAKRQLRRRRSLKLNLAVAGLIGLSAVWLASYFFVWQ